MRFYSTGDSAPAVGLTEALRRCLAPDGGLYLPEEAPPLPPGFLRRLASGDPPSLAETAGALLTPYLTPELAAAEVTELATEALSFPIPLTPLEEGCFLLELFHGPTAAFKDVGARFLARLLARLAGPGDRVTVLVATSGDTGGAVAQAFHRVAGTAVVVLYPQGRVSPLQEHQLATLGGNVRALAVTGTFDDCQRLAKEAFADRALAARVRLTSANSINLGRLLPQAVYYAHAVAQLPPGSPPPCFVVPSGNFGNLTAGVLAARRGVPTGPFVAAVNANRAFPDYLATGVHRPRPSLATLANAMDVGDPSNLARLVALFGGDAAAMGAAIATSSHGDDEIRRAIVDAQRRTGRILDPHTAVGLRAWEEYHRRHRPSGPAVLLATAHPAKFAEVVEPLVGPVTLPPALERFAIGPVARVSIPPEFGALREVLEAPTP